MTVYREVNGKIEFGLNFRQGQYNTDVWTDATEFLKTDEGKALWEKKPEIEEINREYTRDADDVVLAIPEAEILTFPFQAMEAIMWSRDNTFPTYFIDEQIKERQCTKEYIVEKILEKHKAYSEKLGTATGKRQKLEKEILGE